MNTTYIILAITLVVIILYLLSRSPKADRGRPKSISAPHGGEQRVITDDEIRITLHQGNKIQAIKMYRELHNVDLAKAKEAVEAME